MGVSVRTRFEVFKRDRFTCHYCGQTPPAVLLEVDHVVPRAAGGSDDMENLITACQDCNRGKSSKLLTEGSAPTVSRAATEELEDRIAQARAYAEAMQTYRQIEEVDVQAVIAAWAATFQAEVVETGNGSKWMLKEWEQFPRRSSIRTILRRLPLHDVLDAVDVSAGFADRDENGWASERVCRYFYGVCWRWIRERGR